MRVRLLVLGIVICAIALGVLLLQDTRRPRPEGSTILPGLCEASGVVPWEGGFLIGDNETEDRLHGFGPDLAPGRSLPLGTMVEDVEAVAITPAGLLVVGSQGADRMGRDKPLRQRAVIVGQEAVVPDLSACSECVAARSLPPKAGGLSVEGAAWWRGSLWLGLRSPLIDGKAILLRMEGDPSASLSVAEVVPLDLGGQGVRDLLPHGSGLLVLAGPLDGRDTGYRLLSLAAPGALPTDLGIPLPDRAEGMAVWGSDLLVVTDGDGEPGTTCIAPANWIRVSLPAP